VRLNTKTTDTPPFGRGVTVLTIRQGATFHFTRSPDGPITRFSRDPITRSYFPASYNELNHMPLGLYVSVPFCRSKCSFCNFASGVFSRDKMNGYIAQLQEEIASAETRATILHAEFERSVD